MFREAHRKDAKLRRRCPRTSARNRSPSAAPPTTTSSSRAGRRAAPRAHRPAGRAALLRRRRRRAERRRTARPSRRASRSPSISARSSRVGAGPVPLAHPAICADAHGAGTASGAARPARHRPRSDARVARHRPPGGERQHATVMLDRMMVVDHGSTSGTYVGGQRIAAEPADADRSRAASSRSAPSRSRCRCSSQLARVAAPREPTTAAADPGGAGDAGRPPGRSRRRTPAAASERSRASTARSSAS